MKKVIIIGTLHAGLTQENELKEILKKYNPNQLLIEVAQADIKNGKLNSCPPEMVFAYNWAKKNKIRVNGFDSKIDVYKKGITEEDNKRVIKEQKKLMKNLSWKEMNKSENLKKINTSSARKLVNPEKEEKREYEMLKNINKAMIYNGTILIVTGCGHLDFLKRYVKGAIFPLKG